MGSDSDCDQLLGSYDLPLSRSCAEESGAGMPSSVKNVMDFRANVWETVLDDLYTMCLLKKKRLRKLASVQEKSRASGLGTSRAVRLYLRTWSSGQLFEHRHALQNCRAKCEFVDQFGQADVVVKWEYCDARTGTDHMKVDSDRGQLLAFFGWETLFPSFMTDKARNEAKRCWEKLDIYAGYDRFTELPMHFGDLGTLLQIKKDGRYLYPRLPEGSSYKRDLQEAIVMKRNDALGMLIMGNCRASSWSSRAEYRYLYVTELEKYLPMHVYGKCGKHKFPSNMGKEYAQYAPNVQRRLGPCSVISKYRFFFAFENAVRDGYVTEKLWDTLMCPYSIPVFLGAPDIRRHFDQRQWAKYKFFVNANEFPDPRDLATYLHYLAHSETAYMEYFQWRFDGVVPPNMAKPIARVWKNSEGDNISFGCRICELVAGVESSRNLDYGEFLWFGKTADVDQQP